MARSIEHYRQSDVNFWGIVAIAASGLAVIAVSLPAVLPAQFFSALHASRLNGADVNNLRAEMVSLSDKTARLRLDTTQLLTRLGLAEKDRNEIVRRVGALENTLPLLVEQIPPGSPVDASIVTSSVGRATETSAIPGGSIAIERSPLYLDQTGPASVAGEETPPLPNTAAETSVSAVMPNLERFATEQYGVAMGGAVSVSEAYVTWIDLRNKVGALLIGMEPILSGANDGYHVVAGPIDSISRAEELCGYIQRAGLQCLPVSYSGYKMPQ